MIMELNSPFIRLCMCPKLIINYHRRNSKLQLTESHQNCFSESHRLKMEKALNIIPLCKSPHIQQASCWS